MAGTGKLINYGLLDTTFEINLTLRISTSCHYLYQINYWFLIPSVATDILFNNLKTKAKNWGCVEHAL